MGSGSSSTAAPSGPRPQTSIPPINYKSDDANVNRLVQKLSRQSKRRKYPNSTIENSEDDFAERQARNQVE